jgi:hypothetical protein
MQSLDLNTFPVSEGIVYDLIHTRHKHQREEYLKKQRSAEYQDTQARRRHLNSRRKDVNISTLFFLFILFSNFTIYTYNFYNYRNARTEQICSINCQISMTR